MDEYVLKEGKNNIIVENREKATISGVSEVKSFDENEIILETSQGRLHICGSGLHVERLSLEISEIAITGLVISLEYQTQKRQGSFWSKLF